MSGRRIRLLFEGMAAPGMQTAFWDGRGASGQAMPPGFYFVRLRVGERVPQRSLVYLR